ncbi:GNAT family N-acetyltransferase [bacterium SCSIO 12741]|nr:GNAT family N-acetyltransferase [bacterium SCSIO 12741]
MKKWEVKRADTPDEFRQIFRLNYETFVEEIPQHEVNHDQLLVDFQHQRNTYFIAMEEGVLIGMIAINDQRPYSLDHKLENLGDWVQDLDKSCEVRLLAVHQQYRSRGVMLALLKALYEYAQEKDYQIGLISGILKNLPLYEKMGFQAFGPICGSGQAQFQPMMVTQKQMQTFFENANYESF